jgi:hypothetical protein
MEHSTDSTVERIQHSITVEECNVEVTVDVELYSIASMENSRKR